MKKITFQILSALARPVARFGLQYSWERIPEISGPFLLLSNHNTDLDPLLVGLACKELPTFVATEKILRMRLLTPVVMKLCHPIIHYKGRIGISSVKEILHHLKNGESVAFFPEGNRSFNGVTGPFPEATGKMARRSGATLVTYRLRGGYFVSPRWGVGLRRGRMTGEVAGVYPPEVMRSMSDTEVNDAIRRDIFVDAYEDQRKAPAPYRGRNPACALESTLYLCPACHRFGTLRSHGRVLECRECSYTARYDEYGMLTDREGQRHTITELDKIQKDVLKRSAEAAGGEILFSDEVTVETIAGDHTVTSRKDVTLRGYADRFAVGQEVLPLADITGMAINQRNLLIIHYGENGHLELSGDVSFNALKYLYLYQTTGRMHEKI